jgi:Domain of unknown function (DUF6894)
MSRIPCRRAPIDVMLSSPVGCGDAAVPRYTFKLSGNGCPVEDDSGVSLPDIESAYRYACDVVQELMVHRELRTRHWQLEAYEDDGRKIFEIPFAKLDQALDHLTLEYRDLVEHSARLIGSVQDIVYVATNTRREAQALVARSRGRPYLAVRHGRKVFATSPKLK